MRFEHGHDPVIQPTEFLFRGSRIGVLLIHGLTGTPSELRFVGRGLHQAGYTVYGMRLAGHCGTEADLIASGWSDWCASVDAAADRLLGSVDRIFVAGLSMGALLALRLATRLPRQVLGVAAYGPTLRYDGWSIPWIAKLSFMLPYALALGIGRKQRFLERFPYGIKDERIRNHIVNCMFSGDSAAAGLVGNPWPSLAQFLGGSREVRQLLPRIKTPTLLMHATHDDVADAGNSIEIAENLAGPVELMLLDHSYHMITVDAERSRVAEASIRFFDRVAVGSFDEVVPTRMRRAGATA
jgi:carboxylesterase